MYHEQAELTKLLTDHGLSFLVGHRIFKQLLDFNKPAAYQKGQRDAFKTAYATVAQDIVAIKNHKYPTVEDNHDIFIKADSIVGKLDTMEQEYKRRAKG